jgi:hypothetical protein
MHRWFSTKWLLLPLLASGCVTHKLWTETKLDEWNEPAGAPNLRFFYDAKRDDYLIVYDEFSERHFTTEPRAFFLRRNEPALEQIRRPHFVRTNWASHLAPMPLFCRAPTDIPATPYAITGTNGGRFTVYSGHASRGPYALPIYNDGIDLWERIAWTPLTVTADLTIVGGVVVLVVWTGLAGCNASISAP